MTSSATSDSASDYEIKAKIGRTTPRKGRPAAATIKAGGIKKPTSSEKSMGKIKPSDNRVTMEILEKVLAKYDAEDRKEIGDKYGIQPQLLANQWRNTTKAKVMKLLQAEFGEKSTSTDA